MISLIAAVSRNGVIGSHNRLPWRLPADLRRFKALTLGKPVIMGRKTYESIGKPLVGRRNILLTRGAALDAPVDVLWAHDLDEALRLAAPADEVMIIGGAAVYQEALPRSQRLYLTIIDADFAGDAFFPDLIMSEWQERQREAFAAEAGADPGYAYTFVTLERLADSR